MKIGYTSAEPLLPGEQISTNGVRLLVERVVRYKMGSEAQRVICRRIR
jgi:hypothetical protein